MYVTCVFVSTGDFCFLTRNVPFLVGKCVPGRPRQPFCSASNVQRKLGEAWEEMKKFAGGAAGPSEEDAIALLAELFYKFVETDSVSPYMQTIYNNIRPTLDYLRLTAPNLVAPVAASLTRGIPYRKAEPITGVSKSALSRGIHILGPVDTEEDAAKEFEYLVDEEDDVRHSLWLPTSSDDVPASCR